MAASLSVGDLGVDVHRESDGGVAEDLGDDLRLHVGREQHRRGAVAEIVEADRGQAVAPGPVAFSRARPSLWRAGPGGEVPEALADPGRPVPGRVAPRVGVAVGGCESAPSVRENLDLYLERTGLTAWATG